MRSVLKDVGAAFAVLSIYVLTLLVPLHQAAATQRGFAELGYEAFGVWSVCVATSETQSDTDGPAEVCPVTGFGKQVLGLASGAKIVAPSQHGETLVSHFAQAVAVQSHFSSGHPRAPPAAI